MIAPIGPARVAAVRPAQPGPTDDPYEDGLDVEVVTEPTFVPVVDRVAPTGDAEGSQLELSQRPYAAHAASAADPLLATTPPRLPHQDARGNGSVATGFDRRPASNLGDAPRGDFASPFARAMSAYASR